MNLKDGKKGVSMKAFKSTHGLDFLACPWVRDPQLVNYKIGTVHGIYFVNDNSYQIVAVYNDAPGNKHLKDFFEWFENSCKRDGYSLKFLEIMSDKMRGILTAKGFKDCDNNSMEKFFPSLNAHNGLI